jgi:hypothetical protein
MRTRSLVLASFVAAASAVTPALADDQGDVGTIVLVERFTTSADTYLTRHGRLAVRALDGTVTEYWWGGVSCGLNQLGDAHFAALQAAQNNKKMLVRPTSQPGQGQVKCLVGTGFLEKRNLTLFP